ncbi:MAG TPA: sulfatase-like hydrolase/transferase [Anaerolineales bacterium]|nr:sulfatase-like hydrolase/transferase [Anaerolineales bacterium]
MNNQLTRRDFLKLAGLLPVSLSAPQLLRMFDPSGKLQEKPKNVLIVVFDAFSAHNISLHGYGRKTTPNIERLAKRAIVYHNHFAGGNFTTPGTASLLTGVLPWTHRAFVPNSEVAEPFASRNIFGAFRNHYRIAYTHNGWAYTLLRQFHKEIDELIAREKLLIGSFDTAVYKLFKNDDDISSVSWARNMRVNEDGFAYSLFLSHLYESLQEKKIESYEALFPRGLPTTGSDNGFLIEQAVDYIADRLVSISQPFVGYFHFLPPHYPYRTSQEFYNSFHGDGFKPIEKPIDIFARRVSKNLPKKRKEYDEFVLYCDQEFGRLYNHLESSGLLENTWLVLTSDHGEMFERGISGHSTDALYQPVVRIPLMIFEPGRQVGVDVHAVTSAVDVLPTLAHLTGERIPDWTEGNILPPFASSSQIPDRNVYLMRANNNDQYAPIAMASTMLVRENYKLHYYFGYPEVPAEGLIRLFDIASDPEELLDLSSSKKEIASQLLHELKAKLTEIDQPYL